MKHLRPLSRCLLPLLLTIALGAAQAEKADRSQPMHIEADALRHDEGAQTSIFSGNVVLTKGSIVLRGARLEVRQDVKGFQYGTVTAAAGQRAFFRQKRDTVPGAPEEFVEGEAETITYDGRTEEVQLQRRAELRRYRASLLSDELSGARVVYNSGNDTFSVDGSPSNAAGGRVRATLSPKERPMPATAPADPLPALRPSPQLPVPR